ncbi:RHS repeat-associated protein, partial [Undibacterium sp. GrIS 1.8]|uniref:DUF6765 family protein n=1 Tax=Undibacterium sp. GrIS 1.8 TaxID=3143934 RepID=UPI0033936BFB
RYRYDQQGRLIETIQLNAQGQALLGNKTDFDDQGRITKISQISYSPTNGKADPAKWQVRYEYSGNNPQPSVIIRPSVVPGQEMRTTISYRTNSSSGINANALASTITESGYLPTLDGKSIGLAINRSISYRYNNAGQRIEIDGPLANGSSNSPLDSDITRNEYDPKTRLLTKTIAPGNIVTEVLERDGALRPTKIRTSDGHAEQIATISNNWRGQPEQITVQSGKLSRSLSYRYDANGRLTSITLPGNLTTRLQYDQAGRLTHRTLPDGSQVVMQQDTEGRQQSQTLMQDQHIFNSIKYQYDEANRLNQSEDVMGRRSQTQYTDLGRITQVTNALGTSTQFDYDDNGLLSTRTQAANTPDAASLKLAYDNHGQATVITAPNGVATQRRYDDFGRKIVEINPDRGISLYRYDAAGRLIAKIDDTHITTRYTYDYANRLIALGSDNTPTQVQYRYQGQRLTEVISSPDGKAEHATERTSYQIDGFGQITQESKWIAKVNQPVKQDKQGKQNDPEKMIPSSPLTGLSFITSSRYDEAGRLVQQTLPDGHQLRYQYTPADGVEKAGIAHRPGQLNAILFDDKLLIKDLQQSLVGGMTGYLNGNGISQEIKLDGRGRIQQLTTSAAADTNAKKWWQHIQIWFGWNDSTSQPSQPLYRQSNRYDGAGRIIGISRQQLNPKTKLLSASNDQHYGYDALDRLTRLQAADGSLTLLRYDLGGNRISDTIKLAGTKMLSTATQSDANSASNDSNERHYRYAQGSNRLIALTQSSTGDTGNTVGMRMQKTGLSTQPDNTTTQSEQVQSAWLYHATGVPLAQLDFNRAAQHALDIANVHTDANLKANTSRRLVYNSAKRPIAVYGSNNQLIASYGYNVQGERIAKTVYTDAGAADKTGSTGSTSYSLYRDQRLSAETDSEGRITAHYVYLYGKPIAKIEMSANTSTKHQTWKTIASLGGLLKSTEPDASDTLASIYAIHTDHVGTPQMVTDEAQQIVWQADTTPFGMATIRYAAMMKTGQSNGSANTNTKAFEMNLRLPGQVYDAETGLHQNYYRDYDPQLGRYSTPDPIGIEGGINPYSYVNSSPLINIDPLGLYESDIHYYMTYFLAIIGGMSADDARMMALATQFVDDNPNTSPTNGAIGTLNQMVATFSNQTQLKDYHFTLSGTNGITDPAYKNSTIQNPSSPQLQALYSYAVPKIEGGCALVNNTSLQFMGEYLHAFEDTFAHRKADNTPFDAV